MVFIKWSCKSRERSFEVSLLSIRFLPLASLFRSKTTSLNNDRDKVPSEIKTESRWGVPTAIRTSLPLKYAFCSSTEKCFAKSFPILHNRPKDWHSFLISSTARIADMHTIITTGERYTGGDPVFFARADFQSGTPNTWDYMLNFYPS